ncbi:MAG: ferrous iron transport protein A [Endomicrobium sp.]|jgi:ferrous iron transport protein A|nr:ferrous iron transport protein A [Endomicrobium sp.]
MKQYMGVLRYIYGCLHRYLAKFYCCKDIYRHNIHRSIEGKSFDCNHFRVHEPIHGFDSFNKDIVDNFTKLSCANPGKYKLLVTYCDRKLKYRLLEMGFIPGEGLTVISNSAPNGGVMIKIKGAKIALSNEVADKILVREKIN